MANMERTDVVVVGAGGGGAVLGLALAQQGIDALVLEQAPGPPGGVRGEILQPNGQEVMARLGLLNKLPAEAVRPLHRFNFYRAAQGEDNAERLCTVDYRELPPPFNQALVTLPNAVHHVILAALEGRAPGRLRYGTTFRQLLREGSRVVGVEADQDGRALTVQAKLVVGADGALSKVREALGVRTRLHLYPDGYLIALLDDPGGPQRIEEARYFVGRRTILGMFPAGGAKLYLFYLIPAGSMAQVKAAGLAALR